jgi:cytidylate kinase
MKNDNQIEERSSRNIFEKYFNEKLSDQKMRFFETGPYISISREFGCMANPIASMLSSQLSHRNKLKGKKSEWKWINKAIMEEAARELELSPSRIEYVFQSQRKTTMDEIVSAMSARYYKSDLKIRKTIIEVIRSIVISGNIIIVGRGGVAFKKDNPMSLHIKLIAPLEWRINRISENYKINRQEAIKNIREIDRERKFLIDSFVGIETDDTIFDIIFNRQAMDDKAIVSNIIHTLDQRKLI